MRPFRSLPAAILFMAPALALAQVSSVPDVKDFHLANGLGVLCVERPGSGAVHAALFIRRGQADTGELSPWAADLLAHSLLGRITRAGLSADPKLEALLREEEGLHEALRLARATGERLQGETRDLGVARERVMAALEAETAEGDLLEALGVTHRKLEVGADAIAWSGDLPVERLEALARTLTSTFTQALLPRLPFERARLLAAGDPKGQALPILLGAAALPGEYGRLASATCGDLEGLRWSEVRQWARGALGAENMTLVLVGDVSAARIPALLEGTLGRLPRGEEAPPVGSPVEAAPWPGPRSMKVTMPGTRRVLMAWRIPPLSHPDAPILQLLAQMLGAGSGARLPKALQEEQGLAARVSARVGVPGGRGVNLLVVEAEPAEGRGLEELTQALRAEIQRFGSEPLMEGRLQRALRQAEGLSQAQQEDAADLARVLGRARIQTGDWRGAFLPVRLGTELRQEAVQAVLRRYLSPAQSLTLVLEPDALAAPRDLLEVRLVKVLGQLARRKTQDAARIDTLVRDVLQQIRMLTPEERLRTVQLLESQVRP